MSGSPKMERRFGMAWELARPAQHKSLSRQVMEAIEQLILEEKLGPGDVLPTENQIAERLQVSKSSVREAVKMLEALGVVEIRRGLCTTINENPEQGFLNVMLSHFYLGSGNASELQVFRKTIESAYTVQAIRVAVEEDIAAVEEALERFREKYAAGLLTAEDDLAFHSAILNATHNSYLIHLGGALNELFRDRISASIRTDPAAAMRDHELIYKALRERDAAAAERAIARSAEQWAVALSV